MSKYVWGTDTLGNLCDISIGRTPAREEGRYWGKGYPWLSIADMNQGKNLVVTKESITQAAVDECKCSLVPEDTLLMSFKLSIGKLGFARIPMFTNEAIAALPIRNTKRLWPEFLYYALQTVDLIGGTDRAVMGMTLNKEKLKNVVIPLPKLEEQKRIAGILARADRLRQLRRYALQLSDGYLQSVFLQMFRNQLHTDYPKTRLGELVTITGGGTPSRDVPAYYYGDIPWLTAKDMIGAYIFDTQEHITPLAVKKSATKLVPKQSILVVVKSKVLMHRLPLAITKVDLCHGQDIKSIQCSDHLDPVYLMFVLKYNEPGLLRQARGANTEGLTLPMLREIEVPNISLDDQKRFSDIVGRFEQLRAQQREAARQANHLFDTLLHRAFSGEL